ncbi:MAG: translation elongation factor Ts [Rhodobacteraceae bacterium]|nr:translation elongation factor Ts [Paracoccaceae bacterium]
MNISASLVKELRTLTGAGIMDAKKALIESGGEVEAAVDWLRAKGIAKAAKKSGRATGEGQICVATVGGSGVAVEVNSETDFVAKNTEFCGFARQVAEAAVDADNLEDLMSRNCGGATVAEALAAKIAALGENMSVSRMRKLEGASIASYVHNKAAENIGKIGVLVALDGEDHGIGRKIAMHVAATNPISLSEKDAPEDLVRRERQVLSEKAKASGKPEAIIEKIVDGGMKKFFTTETLLNQKFVIDPDITVGEAAAAENVAVTGFVYLRVGESGA